MVDMLQQTSQEESRSISENVTWGQRKRFAYGKVSLPNGRFLRYEKGEDRLPKNVEQEAAVAWKNFLSSLLIFIKNLETNKIFNILEINTEDFNNELKIR